MHPLLFLDDDCVAAALDEAVDAAVGRLACLLPDLDTAAGAQFQQQLRAHLAAMLTGRAGAPPQVSTLPTLVHGEDAFGDRFDLDDLPLPRASTGYAVQMLDTDTLLDRNSGEFLAVRDPSLQGLFQNFDTAHAAARAWLRERQAGIDRYPLAIVPAYYDFEMGRHVLVYGVLTQAP